MIKLYYYHDPAFGNNFGDELSPFLVAQLSGQKVIHTSYDKATLSAAGSILHDGQPLFRHKRGNALMGRFHTTLLKYIRPRLNIWGSGFIGYPNATSETVIRVHRRIHAYALRGKKTLQLLNDYHLLHQSPPPAFGDPGLLYPMLLKAHPSKHYDIGIVPHKYDIVEGERAYQMLKANGYNVKYINVAADDPLEPLREIAACERILSSSLHGCIVADALHIPHRHLVFSHFGYTEKNFYLKFRDYHSAYGDTFPEPLLAKDFFANIKKIEMGPQHDWQHVEEIKANLLNAFNEYLNENI